MLDFAELHDVADAHAPDERTQYALPTVKPPPAQAFAQLRQTFGAAADGIDNPNGRYSTPARIDPADLRTVQPVDLRTPQARVLDAQARDLRTPIEQCPLNYQVDYWTKAIHEAALRLREVSEKMQAQGGAA